MKITARTKVTVLDRAHSLLLVLVGTAASIAVLYLVPIPKGQLTGPSVTLLAAALGIGYFLSWATDVVTARAVRSRRNRWLDAARATDRPSSIPLDTV